MNTIAVWGNNGSGKTTLSLTLAAQLSANGENVVIISANRCVPGLPIYLPNQAIDNNGSLGHLLSSRNINESGMRGHIHIHPENSRIGFMALTSGETPITYQSFDKKVMEKMMKALQGSVFDHVIFDCMSNPVDDIMTLTALQTSDTVIRVTTPDVQGLEFERSQLAWISNVQDIVNPGLHIRVVNPVHKFSALDELFSVSGHPDFVLPFSAEVYNKVLAGQLVCRLGDRYGIQFEKAVRKLAERIGGSE